MKKWRLASKIIGFFLLGAVIVIAGYMAVLIIEGPHWSQEIDDRTERTLSIAVSSVKDGLPVATALAQKWHQDAVLDGIVVFLRGTEAVKSRKGEILYTYYVIKHGSETRFEVTIDTMKQAIIRIEVQRDPRGGNAPNLNWSLDIADIFEIIESSKALTYPDNPLIIIHPWAKSCYVTVGSAPDARDAERVEFIINYSTRQIESVRRFPKSTMPR